MLEKRIYNYDTEWPRTVILNHGASETQIIYDSKDEKPKKPKDRMEGYFSRFLKDEISIL